MTIQIFNSLYVKKNLLFRWKKEKLKCMYVVQLSTIIFILEMLVLLLYYDTVRKYLQYRGYEVTFVSNFTDVDDKIIKAANELGEDVSELTERFIKLILRMWKHLVAIEQMRILV